MASLKTATNISPLPDETFTSTDDEDSDSDNDSEVELLPYGDEDIMEELTDLPSPWAEEDEELEATASKTTTSCNEEVDTKVSAIRGADIVSQTKVEITPGKPFTYSWEGHGFEIHIPADAISDDNGPVTLTIQASLSGDYQLPDDDHVFVSGVYWLALHPPVKFTKEVTVTIQHCGSNDANSTPLSFVKAKTQSTLPYIFKPMPGGSFSDSQKNGVIKIDHFCGIAVSGKQKSFYALCTYYLHKQLNVYETHITVTPDLELQLKDVRDTYKNKEKSEEGPTEVAKINSGEISYEIQDPAGVGIPQRMWEKDGWELLPLIKATLQKEFLDHYEPGNVIPHFEISLKCGDARQSLSQMVKFTGVESETFITILRHPALSEQDTYSNSYKVEKVSETDKRDTGQKTMTLGEGTGPSSQRRGVRRGTHSPDPQAKRQRLTSNLGIDDLFDLKTELSPVIARWKHIGLALRLDPSKLDVIEKENKELEDCLTKVLTLWLKKTYNTERFGEPSWKLLADAVRDPAGGNNPALALKITKKHGVVDDSQVET